jgi:CubicO group peptidase (beta-lactamase class C family)
LFVVTAALAAAPLGAAASDPALYEAAADAARLPRLRSLLVSRRGELVVERYFRGARATAPANIKSTSKSVISALVGIAIDRKLIPGVETPIARWFPERLGPRAETEKRKITVEDLLTMRSGLESTSIRNYGAWVRSADWVGYVLSRPIRTAPGGPMIYSTGNYHLLSAILTNAAGKSTWAFANETLGKPLGFSFAHWPRDPQGIYFGGNEMLMTPRQMLAFGELYLRRGVAGGRQVVPEAWIEASLVPRGRSDWSGQLYGYGWWIRDMGGRRVFYAWGYGGQFIFVVPEHETVIVTTSSVTAAPERHDHLEAIYELAGRIGAACAAGAAAAPASPRPAPGP